eukprot:15240408-Heterocapsa_arctica.AAC.1
MKGPEARRTTSEIDSPPRITQAARSNPGPGIQPGFALDLTTLDEFGNLWDFDDAKQRERAMERVRSEKPQLLIGSP